LEDEEGGFPESQYVHGELVTRGLKTARWGNDSCRQTLLISSEMPRLGLGTPETVGCLIQALGDESALLQIEYGYMTTEGSRIMKPALNRIDTEDGIGWSSWIGHTFSNNQAAVLLVADSESR